MISTEQVRALYLRGCVQNGWFGSLDEAFDEWLKGQRADAVIAYLVNEEES